MKRLLRGLIIGIVTTVVVALGALWLLLGTVRGGQWLVAQAVTFVPGELRVEMQDGSVLSGFTAGCIVYRYESLAVELTDVRVEVGLGGLLRKRIHIGEMTAAAISIDELHLTRVRLTGAIDLRDAFALTANLNWTANDGQVSGRGDFSGDLEQLKFTHHIALPALIDVTGVIRTVLTQPSIDATASFAELPLTVGDDQIEIRDGRIVLSANTETLVIERGEAAVFGGRVRAVGSVYFQAGMAAVLKITGENLDPATLYPDLDGRLGFDLRVDARSTDDVDVVLDRLSGEFLGTPVTGTGSAQLREGLVEQVAFDLQSGQNRLELSGRMQPNFSGELQLNAPELATLWPGVEGRLEGGGRISGTFEEPVALIRLEGSEFRFGALGLQRFNVNGRIDAAGELDWTAQINKIRSGEQNLGNLQLRMRGQLADHRLAARVADGVVGLQLEAHGSWDGERWQETVDSAAIDSGAMGTWTLSEAVSMRASADGGSIDAHCWSDLAAEICTDEVHWHGGRWVGAATLRQFPLATFEPWMGEDIRISGLADADLTVDWDPEKNLAAQFSWRQGETRLSVPVEGAAAQEDEIATTLRDVQITIVANNQVAAIDGHATGDYGLTVRISASLDDPLDEAGRLAGRLDAQIPDIGELRPILNRYLLTSQLGGALDVSANISGTLSAPVAEGSAILRDGSAGLVVNGIELTEANLSITGHEGSALVVDGSVRSGDGLIDIDGQIDWSGGRGVFSDLRLTGSNFEVLRLPNQRATITPTVDVSADSDQIVVAGWVLVPEAEFIVHELGQSGVMISDDVIVHEEETHIRRRAPGPRLVGSLDVQLGDRVSFSGFGIDTRLAGGLQLNQTIDAPLSGEGSLQLVDGSYEMFGKVLTIEQGSLNFYGPLDDPVLDIRAVRQIRYQGQNIKAGVIVSGRISRQLDFMLFSDPAYSETDVLSYLLVDRPASTADGVDGSAISGAAVAMGLQSLTQDMGQGLSLDEVGLEGAGGDDTAVVAGKQLSEGFYVRYTYGLFSRIGTLLIRYDLGRGFSIEAGSGEQQTLDLLYSIDR